MQHQHIIVLSGDERQIQVMKQMATKGVYITAVGFTKQDIEHDFITHQTISTTNFSSADAILLPVAGVDNEGNIAMEGSDEKHALTKELLEQTSKKCLVFSGGANQTLRTIVNSANRTLIPIFERDDVAIANSIPTAEATLQIAMEETKQTIHNANVTIIGFGRIGTTMAHLFHQVGANVTVAARKNTDIAKIKTLHYQAVHSEHMVEVLQQSDIIINTVPALLLDKDALETVTPGSLIIDVASKPGGTDFNMAEQLGIKAIHALALPGKVAPITAGNIIADILIEQLH